MKLFTRKPSWTKWADIIVFPFGSNSYLLQGRKHIHTGEAEFKVREALWAERLKVDDLKATGLWSGVETAGGEG
jgi:hypothetical protein